MSADRAVLVVHKGDHSVGYYSLADGGDLGRVEVDPYPHELALSNDRRFAFLSHFGVALAEDSGEGGNTVSVVDIAARRRVARLSCGPYRRPHGIAVDTLGRILVTSEGSSRLLTFDADQTGPVQVQTTGGRGSHFVALHEDGNAAYCSNMVSNTLTVLDRRGGQAPVAIAVGDRPEGSVLSGDGSRLYVTCRESACISVIDTENLCALEPIPSPAGPVRVCLDDSGRLLVALYHGRALAIIDPANTSDSVLVPLPDKAISVSFDATARLVLLSVLGNQVIVVDLNTLSLARRIDTRADPDPAVVVALNETSETA